MTRRSCLLPYYPGIICGYALMVIVLMCCGLTARAVISRPAEEAKSVVVQQDRPLGSHATRVSFGPAMAQVILDGDPCPGLSYVVDPRDGNIYATVLIGEQCWLRENLRYLPRVHPPGLSSDSEPHYYVYGYDGFNREEAMSTAAYQDAGVLYNYPAAVVACPVGWQLPGEFQWNKLSNYLTERYPEVNPDNLGANLKSMQQVDAPRGEESLRWAAQGISGSDDFNFSALPGGRTDPGQSFIHGGTTAYWWSSASTDQYAAFREMPASDGGLYSSTRGAKHWGLSVRCVLAR